MSAGRPFKTRKLSSGCRTYGPLIGIDATAWLLAACRSGIVKLTACVRPAILSKVVGRERVARRDFLPQIWTVDKALTGLQMHTSGINISYRQIVRKNETCLHRTRGQGETSQADANSRSNHRILVMTPKPFARPSRNRMAVFKVSPIRQA